MPIEDFLVIFKRLRAQSLLLFSKTMRLVMVGSWSLIVLCNEKAWLAFPDKISVFSGCNITKSDNLLFLICIIFTFQCFHRLHFYQSFCIRSFILSFQKHDGVSRCCRTSKSTNLKNIEKQKNAVK